ncbi:hypothetical protein F441_22996, partial [Phytophthora nicotianae CJ01A1]
MNKVEMVDKLEMDNKLEVHKVLDPFNHELQQY